MNLSFKLRKVVQRMCSTMLQMWQSTEREIGHSSLCHHDLHQILGSYLGGAVYFFIFFRSKGDPSKNISSIASFRIFFLQMTSLQDMTCNKFRKPRIAIVVSIFLQFFTIYWLNASSLTIFLPTTPITLQTLVSQYKMPRE